MRSGFVTGSVTIMQDGSVSPDAFSVALVGAGALGTVLGRGLAENGQRVEAVLSRSAKSARALADRVGASVAGSVEEEALPAAVRLVLICVPDDAIAGVAERLAGFTHPWDDTIVAHTSGAQPAAVLDPVARKGAATMSFHPLQTFTEATSPAALNGIFVGLEGDERALAVGEVLASKLGAHPVRLTPEEKARYHCAAALASNGLVALMAVVEEVFGSLEDVDATGRTGTDLVAPLIEHTWAHLDQGSPEEALTGPVRRGDEGTVQAHLDALQAETPHLVPLYAALSTEMVRVAVRAGLPTDRAEALLETLREATEAATDADDLPPPSR
jgi:predicted short-subunit dehydrogenase-like oxidoreductase (DUF2520 family)